MRKKKREVSDIEERLMEADILREARALCAQYGVTVGDAASRSRARPVVKARHALWHFLARLGWSLSYTGRIFGVHHTTVRSAILDYDEDLKVRTRAMDQLVK